MASSDEILMKAVLEQVNASDFKLDYDILATAIGAPTGNAARVRWSRFKSKLAKSDSSATGLPTHPIPFLFVFAFRLTLLNMHEMNHY